MMSIMGCGVEELAEILTALGYQSQHVELAQVPAQPAEAAEEPQSQTPEGAEAPLETSVETSVESSVETPAETSAETSETGTTEAEAVKLITLWRPARTQRNPQNHAGAKRKNGAENGKKNGGKSQSRAASKGRQGTAGKPKRAEKQADPNSPFAVLKSLQSGGNE
jgi:hypothetical protein